MNLARGRCKYWCVLFLLTACKVHYVAPEQGFPRMDIAEGGGFTGAVTTYTVMKSGQVFKSATFQDSAREIMSIKRKEARKFLKEVKGLMVGTEPVYEPDNVYKVLRYMEKDSTYTLLWYHNRPLLDTLYYRILHSIEKSNQAYQ